MPGTIKNKTVTRNRITGYKVTWIDPYDYKFSARRFKDLRAAKLFKQGLLAGGLDGYDVPSIQTLYAKT